MWKKLTAIEQFYTTKCFRHMTIQTDLMQTQAAAEDNLAERVVRTGCS